LNGLRGLTSYCSSKGKKNRDKNYFELKRHLQRRNFLQIKIAYFYGFINAL